MEDTESNTPLWVFFTFFLNCTIGTKSRKVSDLNHLKKMGYFPNTG